MKFIVNENFQFKGMHRVGVTLTISANLLEQEIKKGRHPEKRYGEYPWVSGLLNHCTAANDATADFISEKSGEKVKSAREAHNEQDDSEEIREIREEFDKLGKGYDKRWRVKRLRNEIIKTRKEIGDIAEETAQMETIGD